MLGEIVLACESVISDTLTVWLGAVEFRPVRLADVNGVKVSPELPGIFKNLQAFFAIDFSRASSSALTTTRIWHALMRPKS